MGYSEAETLPELGKDIATGGALGGALPVVGRGIAKGIQGIPQATGTILKKGLQGGLGVSSELLNRKFLNRLHQSIYFDYIPLHAIKS